MWGNGGWRCTAHSSVQILDGPKLAEYGGGEVEEAVRHYRFSVASGSILHQSGLERCFGAREGGRDHAVHLTGFNGLYGSGSDSYFVCSLKGMLKARGFISHLKNGENQPALDATANAGSNGFIWCLYELLPSTQPYLKIAVVPGLLRAYVLLLHRTIHPFIFYHLCHSGVLWWLEAAPGGAPWTSHSSQGEIVTLALRANLN